jgi:flavin-dependent dehydrogenase
LDELAALSVATIPSIDSPRATLENAAGQTVSLDLHGLRIYRRRDLDPALMVEAEKAGARIIAEKADRLEACGDRVVVEARGRARSFDWLVGADGAHGLSRRTLGLRSGAASIGAGASLEGEEPASLIVGFPDLGDAYLWIFPRPGGCSVGVAYTPDRVSRGAAESALARFVVRHLPGASAKWRGPGYRYPIPVFSSETARSARAGLAGRILLVGDAVGLADPLTREGIRPAVRSGRLAAACLVAGDPESYPLRLVETMGSEMRRAERATELFFDDPVGQWMVPICRSHPGVRRVLGDLLACRQPYRGLRRRLVKAAVGVRPEMDA